MKKEKVRILVLSAIFIALGLMYYVKNMAVEPQVITGDFALNVEYVNLEELRAHNLPIIIDFGADECGPCIAMAPVLDKVSKDMQGKALIKFVDVWKNPDATKGFPVTVIPTQVIINADGTPYKPSKDLGIEFTMYGSKKAEGHAFTAHQGGLTEEQMLAILADMGVK